MTPPAAVPTTDDDGRDNQWNSLPDRTDRSEHVGRKEAFLGDGGDDDDDDDDDDFHSISNQMAGEGSDAPFHYDRNSLWTPKVSSFRTSHIPGYDTQRSPTQSTRDYIDPLIATEEMLWLRINVGNLVETTLDRMGRAFAYNSVYILKVVMDLQSVYRTLPKVQPRETALLNLDLVLTTATVLSHRLTRKQKDNASLSRELQLRTLISALTLISRSSPQKLACETYAQLLRDISESDADNNALYAEDGDDAIKIGDNEYLTRYACDLVRSLPADMPPQFGDLSQEVIHFLFATGFINQLEERPSRKTIDELFSRITAQPSHWHSDFRHMYEGVTGAILWRHQSKFKSPTKASQFALPFAMENAKSILRRLEEELKEHLRPNQFSAAVEITTEAGGETEGLRIDTSSARDSRIFICGMMDLLAQLVATFPDCREIADEAVDLALRVIQQSRKRAFRSKALEIIMCSTVGVGENEYYETMRSLDNMIEELACPDGGLDNRPEEEQRCILEHVEQLKQEKREAMERYEKKTVLHIGAMESIQRRLLSEPTPESHQKSVDYILQQNPRFNTQYNDDNRVSSVPTLSSAGQSAEDSREPVETHSHGEGTMDSMAVIVSSPTEATSCHCFSSTESESCDTCTCRSPSTRDPMSPAEIPVMFVRTPNSPFDKPGTLPTTPRSGTVPIMLETSAPASPTGDSEIGPDSKLSKARRLSAELPIPVITPSDDPSYSTTPNPISHTSSANQLSESSLATPISTYPEPPQSPPSSPLKPPIPIRRRSFLDSISGLIPITRTKPRTDKPLPPLRNNDHPSPPTSANLADVSAEKEVVEMSPRLSMPPRSHSALELRRGPSAASSVGYHGRNNSVFGIGSPPVTQPGFTQLSTIADSTVQETMSTSISEPPVAVNYTYEPIETSYQVAVKSTCFTTCLSPDGNYVAFLSPHSFQVWIIPPPDQPPPQKPLYVYILGEFEGLKKSKVKWEYKAIAMSEQYVATMTKERIYVHDLYEENRVIYHDQVKGWEYSAVTISADKLVVGLSNFMSKGECMGKIQIFHMSPPTLPGLAGRPRYEFAGKDLNLPIDPTKPQDAPHVLSLTRCGNFLSCGTPKLGYYFTWDISWGEPRIMTNRQLRFFEGPTAEVITNVALFPDAQHLFVSTFPAPSTLSTKEKTNGSYIESLQYGIHGPNQRSTGQVSPRVNASCMSPAGDALAFLSYNGTVWITPVTWYNNDDNLTCVKSHRTTQKLMMQNDSHPETPFGRVTFAGRGERVVAVDRKGRVLVLSFPLKSPAEQQAMQAQYAGYGVQRQPSTMTHMSNGTHAYYAGTPSYNASMSSFQAPTNMSAISLMSPMSTDQTDYGGFF